MATSINKISVILPGVFSLADEARNTSQHNHWDTNSHLRNKPVTFVSAGASEPLKQLDDELLKTDGAEERNLVPPETNIKTPLEQLSEPELLAKDGHSVSTPDHEAKDESFQSDNVSTIPPQEPGNMPGSPDPDAQTPEKLASDDGKAPDGLFYFDLGRDARTSPMEQPKADIPVAHDADQEGNSSDEEVILFKGRDASAHPPDQKRPPPTVANMELKIQVVDERLAVKDDKPRAPDNNKAKSLPAGRGRKSRQRKRSDSDALLADYIANMQESGEIDQLLALDSRNTRDLGGSQDEEEILGQGATNTVQSSGTKPNATGVQTEPPSAVEIGGARSPAKDHYSSQSEADDEALAKLIAGQDLNDTLDQAWPEGSSSSTSGSDDDETGLLNQFDIDDFDVMDWERPSVRQRKKGKASRAQLTMDVSDDELEQTLQMAWKNDRLKKSQRKKQREELRALGLLGKNASKPDDPRVKYPEGMNLQQVAEEMKDFLRGGQQRYVIITTGERTFRRQAYSGFSLMTSPVYLFRQWTRMVAK